MRLTQSGPINPAENFHTIDPIAPNCEVDLPPAEAWPNVQLTLKVMPGAIVPVNIRATNGNSIDREASLTLGMGECVTLRSDGGQAHPTGHGIGWLIVSRAF